MAKSETDPEKEWQKTLQAIKNPTARAFFTKAKPLVQASGGFAMKRGSPEFEAWAEYFRKIGWAPFAMKLAASGPNQDAEVTMPTQWPQWFDTSAA